MASVSPIDTETRFGKAVQYLVSLVYLMAPVSYWGYQIYLGNNPDMLIWVLVVAIAVVSMYTVYGVKETEKALESAQELTGQDSGSDESEE